MPTVDEHRRNFEAWYVQVLESLYPRRDAGIAVFMVTLPLAERYLRQMNGLSPDKSLDDACMQTLVAMFPVLATIKAAREFWAVYRNGFLHEASLSRTTRSGVNLPIGWLSHDHTSPIQIEASGTFWVNPVAFSQTVIAEIRKNFGSFASDAAPVTPLPGTVVHVGGNTSAAISPAYIGTGGR